MARFDGGWVKLHRKVLDTDIGKNFLLLGIWVTLIRWANWTDSKINWRGTPRTLGRGEILTSLQELAEFGGIDRKTAAKWINYLELRGSIQTEKSPKGSRNGLIIKVLNYEKYQSVDALYSHEPGHERGDEPGHDGPMSLPTYKELKNIRIKEVEPLPPEKIEVLKKIDQKIIELTMDTSFSRHAAKMIERFPSFEEFEAKLEEMLESTDKAKTKPAKRRYLKNAILKEIGVIRESAAS